MIYCSSYAIIKTRQVYLPSIIKKTQQYSKIVKWNVLRWLCIQNVSSGAPGDQGPQGGRGTPGLAGKPGPKGLQGKLTLEL